MNENKKRPAAGRRSIAPAGRTKNDRRKASQARQRQNAKDDRNQRYGGVKGKLQSCIPNTPAKAMFTVALLVILCYGVVTRDARTLQAVLQWLIQAIIAGK